MKEQSADKILSTTIEKVRTLVDTDTIIGDAIKVDAITIIPVSKVTYGFASGGSDFPSKNNMELFGGGGGAGITITPIAFIVVENGSVSIKNITAYDNAAEKVVNLVPEMFDKVKDVVNKIRKEKESKQEQNSIKEDNNSEN